MLNNVYAECHCIMPNVIRLSVIMLNVIRLSVIMLNVIMLSVLFIIVFECHFAECY